jgi:uncharacterized membrane protein HdeD (DUF308 family)
MDEDAESLTRNLWWMGVVQGAIAVFFGIAAIFWPGITLVTLLWLFAAFLIVMGLAEIITGLVSIGKSGSWWLATLIGFISLAVGVFLIRNPETSLQTFIVIAGLILIARGIIDAIRAFAGSEGTQHRVLTAIIGILAILAGIAILAQPVAGGVAFVWILGLYALFYGALLMSISFSARNALNELTSSKR